MTEARNNLLKQAIVESAEDPAYFCRFFLRKWFKRPLPAVHLGLLALFTRKVNWLNKEEYRWAWPFLLKHFKYMAEPGNPDSARLAVFQVNSAGRIVMVAGANNAVVMPRGFAKTTLMNAVNLYELLTDSTTFCVYVSESADHAERQLGNIKRQLERNELLRDAYGNVVPTRAETEKWGADEIQLKNGAILLARGRGSQVRGLNFDGRRPNRILLDDVEDKESVATDIQRKKVSNWFYGDVVPAGNEMDNPGEEDDDDLQADLQINVLGTLLHSEALLVTLQADVTFNCISFGAQLEDETMLWEDKMSLATYLKRKERYRRVGKLAEFVREFDSSIRIEEEALFGFFPPQFYIPTPLSALIQIAIALDPAISENKRADSAAMMAGGRREDGLIWVLDEWGGIGKTPRQKIDQLFEWFIRFDKRAKVGIESQQYQKALIYIAQEEMARRQLFFNITPIYQGNEQKKDDRISGILQPRYSNGYVRHAKPLPNLEAQLQDFPNGKKDYADACAMMMSLLGETSLLAAPEGTVTQDEYEPLAPLIGTVYNEGQAFIYSPSPHDPRTGGRYG